MVITMQQMLAQISTFFLFYTKEWITIPSMETNSSMCGRPNVFGKFIELL